MLDEKYFKWVKFDLHHHTNNDPSRRWQNSRLAARNPEWKKILDSCDENHVRLIALTDTNDISVNKVKEYKKYVEKKKYEITILPGIELKFKVDSKKLDIIFIFDDKNLVELEKVFKKFEGYECLKNNYRIDYWKWYQKFCMHLIQQNIKFIRMVHGTKSSNSLSNISSDKLKNLATFEFFEGQDNQAFIYIQKNQSPVGKSNIPRATQHSDLAKISCFKFEKEALKKLAWWLGEWNFDGLMEIAKRPQKRIFPGEEPSIVSEYIKKASLSDGKDLIFRPGLNVIIGRRGSGKSFLIKAINNFLNNPKPTKFIKNIEKSKDFPSTNVFYFEQNKISGDLQELTKRRAESEEQLSKKLKKHSLIDVLNSTLSDEATSTSKLANFINLIKQNILNIKTNFKKLIQEKVIKIQENVRNMIFEEQLNFTKKLKLLFDPKTFSAKIKNFKTDLEHLNKVQQKLKIKQLKNEIWNIYSTWLQKYDEYGKLKRYNDIFEKIHIIFDEKYFNNSKTKQILANINAIETNLINDVTNFQKNFNTLKTQIKNICDNFQKYGEKQEIDIINKSFSFEGIDTKLYIQIKTTCFFEYFRAQLWFIFKQKKISKITLENLFNLQLKTNKTLNDNYEALFEIKAEIWVDDSSMEKCSPGQQFEKFLQMYLNQKIDTKLNSIIIFDQPDDNLDALTVNEKIIKELIHKYHFSKQIIVVTHDPKIALNADPQNLILTHHKGSNKFSYENISKTQLNKLKIFKLLDGEKDYPYHRFLDYGGYTDGTKSN